MNQNLKPAARLAWHRDAQGLWADVPGEDLRMYVRTARFEFSTGYRVLFSELVTIGDLRVADVTKPLVRVSVDDTQRMAKAVAAEFASEPWSDGSPVSRATRAISAAYRRTDA